MTGKSDEEEGAMREKLSTSRKKQSTRRNRMGRCNTQGIEREEEPS
jgi:hypothetical protein